MKIYGYKIRVHRKRYIQDIMYQAICQGLLETVNAHGDITQKLIPAAAKRIAGRIKHFKQNGKLNKWIKENFPETNNNELQLEGASHGN